jgi:hypothetical protein
MTAVWLAVALVAALPTDQQFADRWLTYRKDLLAKAPAAIDKLAARGDRDSLEEAAVLKVRLDQAKTGGDMSAPSMGEPKVGAVGTVRRFWLKVVQRVSATEARVEILREATPDELRLIRKGFLARPTVDVLLKNANLSDKADGQVLTSDMCFAVTGTQTYTTALGAPRTVFVLEPFETKGAEAIYKKALAEERTSAKQVVADRERRAEAKRQAKKEASARTEARKYPALLKNGQNLAKVGLYAAAEKKFRQIVAESPGSEPAEQAKKELEKLPPH